MIKKAKKEGLQVTCDIAAHQTSFYDTDLEQFDTNFKVNPPFRTANEARRIYKALKEDTIDVIVSSHQPQDEESKKLEYDLADFGINGMQTVAHHITRLIEQVPASQVLHKITIAPRQLLGLDIPPLELGAEANLTLFDPTLTWELNEKTNRSKSHNNPLFRKEVKGGIRAVLTGKEVYKNQR